LREELTMRTFGSDEASVREHRRHAALFSTGVFARKGCDRTNTRELATACEMSIGTLYHYSGLGEEILCSTINRAASQQTGSVGDCANDSARASSTIMPVGLVREPYEWYPDNEATTPFVCQAMKNLPGNARQSGFLIPEHAY
jgi:hypothetical protein